MLTPDLVAAPGCGSNCPRNDGQLFTCVTDKNNNRFSLRGGTCVHKCSFRRVQEGACPEHKDQVVAPYVPVREGDKTYYMYGLYVKPLPHQRKFPNQAQMHMGTFGRRGTEKDFPFLDYGGFKGGAYADANTWKVWRNDQYRWWRPYGLPGAVYEDGGLLPPAPGELPVVNPPKERLGAPYFMRPRWLEGDESVNEYYKQHCPIRVHGRLHYEGPENTCANASFDSDTTNAGEQERCDAEPGHYVWGWLEQFPDGTFNDQARSGPRMETGPTTQQLPGIGGEHNRQLWARQQKWAEFYLRHGYELPPWYRRGAEAMGPLIRKMCPVGGKKRVLKGPSKAPQDIPGMNSADNNPMRYRGG